MKKTLKLFTLLALVAGVSLTGCKPDDPQTPTDGKEPVSISLTAPGTLAFEMDADSEPVEAPFKVVLDKAVDYAVTATLSATQDEVFPQAVCSFEVDGEATSTVVIPAGETEVEVTLVIAAYDLPASTHSVQVSISSATPAEATVSGAPFTITLSALGEEREPVTVSLTAPTTLAFEMNAASAPVEAPFKVQLAKAVDYAVTATLTANPNANCSFKVGGAAVSSVVIPAGQTEIAVVLVIAAHNLTGSPQSVQVSISSAAPAEATVEGAPFTITLSTPVVNKEPVSVSLTAPTTLAFEMNAASAPVEAPFKVQLAKAVDYSVTANLTATPNANCSFKVGGAAVSSVVIPAGQTEVAVVLAIAAHDLATSPQSVQVSIASATPAEATVSGAPFTLTLTTPKPEPTTFSAPVFTGYGQGGDTHNPIVGPYPAENWNLVLPAFTIEAWTNMDGYNKNNQQLFNNRYAQTEVFMRFGDNQPYNHLAGKLLGYIVDPGAGNRNVLTPNIWYHWAITFDGTTITVYKDGEVYASGVPVSSVMSSITANGGVKFPTLQMICSGLDYFPDDCTLTEVRFWKEARSQADVKANMTKSIESADYGKMVAYWPMHEVKTIAEKTVFEDVSGNGVHCDVTVPAIVRWVDNLNLETLK